jgi:predicted AAA+ superfamily ATPase
LFGALFENMIVIDRLKSRHNSAQPAECYFYRDNIGNEVDLIEPQGAKVRAIEIKAGATINSDYFKALGRFRKAFPERFLDGTVIYGGKQLQKRSDWTVWPWDNADNGIRVK